MSKIEYRTEKLITFWSLREQARKKEETQPKECLYCKKRQKRDVVEEQIRKAA